MKLLSSCVLVTSLLIGSSITGANAFTVTPSIPGVSQGSHSVTIDQVAMKKKKMMKKKHHTM